MYLELLDDEWMDMLRRIDQWDSISDKRVWCQNYYVVGVVIFLVDRSTASSVCFDASILLDGEVLM